MFVAHRHPSTQRWCPPLAAPATPQVANVLVSRANGRTSGGPGPKHRNFRSPTLKHRNFRRSSILFYFVDLLGLGVGVVLYSIMPARPIRTRPKPHQPTPTQATVSASAPVVGSRSRATFGAGNIAHARSFVELLIYPFMGLFTDSWSH
jgi:hypothetical protein